MLICGNMNSENLKYQLKFKKLAKMLKISIHIQEQFAETILTNAILGKLSQYPNSNRNGKSCC